MKLFRIAVLTAISIALCDCASVIDSVQHGFYVNSITAADKSHVTTATQLGYRLGIPF